jgi:hypothetical protein
MAAAARMESKERGERFDEEASVQKKGNERS